MAIRIIRNDVIKGLKSKIKELNPLPTYVSCAGHSLELVGSAGHIAVLMVSSFLLNNRFKIYISLLQADERFLFSKLKNDPFLLKILPKSPWIARAESRRL